MHGLWVGLRPATWSPTLERWTGPDKTRAQVSEPNYSKKKVSEPNLEQHIYAGQLVAGCAKKKKTGGRNSQKKKSRIQRRTSQQDDSE